jgi:hypothetical protein
MIPLHLDQWCTNRPVWLLIYINLHNFWLKVENNSFIYISLQIHNFLNRVNMYISVIDVFSCMCFNCRELNTRIQWRLLALFTYI